MLRISYGKPVQLNAKTIKMYATMLDTVKVQLSPVVLLTNLEKLPAYQQTFLNSQQAISKDLRNISNDPQVVHQHQEELAKLSDLLYVHRMLLRKEHIDAASLDQFYATLAKGFDDLLDHIIRQYPHALHPTIPAPHSYTAALRTQFTTMVKEVRVKADGKPIDQELLELVLDPIIEIINQNEKEEVTQWSLFYYRELLKELLWATSSHGQDKRIYYILMNLNFNSYGYYFYCKEKLHRKLEELKDNAARIQLLSWFKKEIHANLNVKYPGMALLPKEKSWATLMLTCIEEEQKFLYPEPVSKEVVEHITEEEASLIPKLKTSLSVKELALMVRAYIDAGIITNLSVTESRQFITKMLSTKKMDVLSENAFKTQYYNHNIQTIAACKRRLNDVLKILTGYEKGLK